MAVPQGQMTWASPPRMLRLAEPYVVGVLEDCLQILPLQQDSADAMSQVQPLSPTELAEVEVQPAATQVAVPHVADMLEESLQILPLQQDSADALSQVLDMKLKPASLLACHHVHAGLTAECLHVCAPSCCLSQCGRLRALSASRLPALRHCRLGLEMCTLGS